MLDGREEIMDIVKDRKEMEEENSKERKEKKLMDSIVKKMKVGVLVKEMKEDGSYVIYNKEE